MHVTTSSTCEWNWSEVFLHPFYEKDLPNLIKGSRFGVFFTQISVFFTTIVEFLVMAIIIKMMVMIDYVNYYQDDGDDTVSLEVLQGNAEKMLEGSNDNNDPSQSSFQGSFTLDKPTNEMEF
jgi:hypothetical protein